MSTTKEKKTNYETEITGDTFIVIVNPNSHYNREEITINLREIKKLTESFIEEWTEALRSGDYRQISGSLCKLNGEPQYCCLGVAAVIRGYSNDILEENNYLKGGINGSLVRLPRTMWKNTVNDFFAGLNDKGLDFEQIADVIEFAYYHNNNC